MQTYPVSLSFKKVLGRKTLQEILEWIQLHIDKHAFVWGIVIEIKLRDACYNVCRTPETSVVILFGCKTKRIHGFNNNNKYIEHENNY
jgi:hypothetical protein